MNRNKKFLGFIESVSKASPENSKLISRLAAGFNACFEGINEGNGNMDTAHTALVYKGVPVTFFCGNYSNGSIGINMCCDDGPYCTLTVNAGKLEPDCVAIDTKNEPGLIGFIKENNIGTEVGSTIIRDCEYPVVKLNMNEIRKHSVPGERIA